MGWGGGDGGLGFFILGEIENEEMSWFLYLYTLCVCVFLQKLCFFPQCSLSLS